MGILDASIRAPTFRTVEEVQSSKDGPGEDQQLERSLRCKRETATQLISAHCTEHPTRCKVNFNVREVTNREVAITSQVEHYVAMPGSSRPISVWRSAEVSRPDEEIRISDKGGIIAFAAEPKPLDSTSDAVVPEIVTHSEVVEETLVPWNGPAVNDSTPTQSTGSPSARTMTSLFPVSAFAPDAAHEEDSVTFLSDTVGRPLAARIFLTAASNFHPESTHGKTIEDPIEVGDSAVSMETLGLLEVSLDSGLGIHDSGESLTNRPCTTNYCDAVANVAFDAGAATRKDATPSWSRSLQQQMHFLALGAESEMPSALDPFYDLSHHVNSLKF